MLNRQFEAKADQVRPAGVLPTFVRDTLNGMIKAMHHVLLVVGVIAVCTLAILFVRPEMANQFKVLPLLGSADKTEGATDADAQLAAAQPAVSAANTAKAQAQPASSVAALGTHDHGSGFVGNSRQQQWVTSWLSKRYRVATDATNMLVSAAYLTAKEIKLDPLLILSVIAIESRFNPFAESPVGAQGLMQVMSKVHRDKFEDLGGVKAALNPVANIKVGALILKEYVERGGSVEAGLKLYVGAGALEHDSGYGAKVLAEYSKLKEVAMGKKVPIFSSSASAAAQKPQQQERKAEPVSADNGDQTPNGNSKLAAL
ncbi:transglycosylase SLT domain-containing protein [Noviherbaspirillum massiliense]|uniref:transglycosylase SLT domain-containing protein n=1 Tax=Noviherbaspirillum massiliense TaxID=1465823 RepID=UPI00037210C7